ncbi:protein-glutamate O-methyltransferase CheR [Bacillus toyonensis]|uniref:CheR family methyltransferase n=1 Tax=Bacillus toyonensis TaxID=155322 RepID=UPI002E2311C9|nr:protein-glutamate O-methyltransferase CheR [Bacillus toyonensis]
MIDTKNYHYFVQEFKKITHIDLLKYKDDQMMRRLNNFIRTNDYKDYLGLAQSMRTDKQLVKELEEYITINVTEFMRNEKPWKDFYQKIVPELVQSKRKLKIWSAACSSGEEPYTVAMLMKEHFPGIEVEIIATDIDISILEKAKKGIYRKADLKTLDKRLLTKYFDEVDDKTVKVKEEIKKKVKFERHNLLESPYPKFLDIVICRNVLIYFKDDVKTSIYGKFSQSLNEGGVLFIGSTEQIFNPKQFNFHSKVSFFYHRKKEGN